MYSADRDAYRRQFVTAFQRHRAGAPLEPLERQLVAVILEHPEYHDLLADPERALGADFPVEAGQTNPFLHMAMHLAIREQVATDRPAGVAEVFRRLAARGDPLAAEHAMMECLGRVLWAAQRGNTLPDEGEYLDCLRKLL